MDEPSFEMKRVTALKQLLVTPVTRGKARISVLSDALARLDSVKSVRNNITKTPVFASCSSTQNHGKTLATLQSRAFSSEPTQGEKYEFKAEIQKLLQIVAHSLYTDKEVFIRELISNASDALEKLRFLEATEEGLSTRKIDADVSYKIKISTDPKAKTFTIEDTGVGMDKEEIINNLGTIAKSGSLAFLEDPSLNAKDKANAIIGQFGVGFYSSFVVSQKVEVFTRSFDPQKGIKGYHWVSDGSGSFTIKETENLPRGTKIVCHLKDDCLVFANTANVKKVAEKFSAFVNFPLYIQEKDSEVEITTQKPLWMEKTASDEEHTKFFRYLNNASWGEPMYKIQFHSDAPLSIKSLLYIPEDAPSRMFTSSNEVGVSLHSRKILIQKSAETIIPKWLFFVKGVIDCEDIPLNVSRELVQDSQLVKKLANTIVKRILKYLIDESKRDPEKFRKFYDKYHYYIKEGVLDESHKHGPYRDQLLQLLRYESSLGEPNQLMTLDEYIANMKDKQKNIYYFCAANRETALASPYMETFKRRNRNVLLLYEDIDEFVSMNIQEYKEKKMIAIDSPEEDFEPELEKIEDEEAAEVEVLTEEQRKQLSEFIQTTLGTKVSTVKFSDRLVDSPAVVTGFLSSALRKVMKATMKGATDAGASLSSLPATLEINPKHKINTTIYHVMQHDTEIAKMLVEQLYDNASIAAGIVDDPRTMLGRLNNILSLTAEYARKNTQ
ncbi:putative heat shock protein [Babesia sp. Xinjiang]|uniref:putative heat shock protein n=1 Tax=Babesia sp. Xinjiang TaxID=462227 RepID=UPI000A2443AD|nr:putative heat shock protein [Babesia sp. Xinjiang]ORM39499.1 putative heat shock protein [Babesia sp. Xinjiang]